MTRSVQCLHNVYTVRGIPYVMFTRGTHFMRACMTLSCRNILRPGVYLAGSNPPGYVYVLPGVHPTHVQGPKPFSLRVMPFLRIPCEQFNNKTK